MDNFKGTKTFYFRHSNYNKDFNVAITLLVKEKFPGYIIGTAVCNPNDQFCKKIGRKIALGRLEKKPIFIPNEAFSIPLIDYFSKVKCLLYRDHCWFSLTEWLKSIERGIPKMFEKK